VSENVSEKAAADVRIVFGASVTEMNAVNLIKIPDVDGFLVGSTSCKPIFRTIFELSNKHVESDSF
jgi:triosephosphate isomerase